VTAPCVENNTREFDAPTEREGPGLTTTLVKRGGLTTASQRWVPRLYLPAKPDVRTWIMKMPLYEIDSVAI
jgi:hypothetical protein